MEEIRVTILGARIGSPVHKPHFLLAATDKDVFGIGVKIIADGINRTYIHYKNNGDVNKIIKETI